MVKELDFLPGTLGNLSNKLIVSLVSAFSSVYFVNEGPCILNKLMITDITRNETECAYVLVHHHARICY